MMIFAAVIMVWVVTALLGALVIGRMAADRSSHAVWLPADTEPAVAEIPAQRTPARTPERSRTS